LQLAVPKGWFLPVTPGTKFVTVGGCIANDVHGKNHHGRGRSDGTCARSSWCAPTARTCIARPTKTQTLFRATIGGLGLTGLITIAEIATARDPNRSDDRRRSAMPFRSLDEFDALSRACDATHDYTVAWFDSFSRPRARAAFSFAAITHRHGVSR
jgi:FAD/FMN-containing dehydrogenase